MYELFGTSFQSVKRLFVLPNIIAACTPNNEAGINNNGKFFFQVEKRTDSLIEQYDKVRRGNNIARWWLYYRMFIRLCIFQRQLQTNFSLFN